MAGAGSRRRTGRCRRRDPTPFYLHADGRLGEERPAADAPPLTYDFDPSDPVPTIGGALTSGQPVFEGGGFDQREAARFFGCRASGPAALGAPGRARLRDRAADRGRRRRRADPRRAACRSDAPDTDFTAKLIDVYPPSDGLSRRLCDDPHATASSAAATAHRGSSRSRSCPGEVFEITIEPFRDGQSLRQAATASGSTSRRPTSRSSTSTRTPALRRGPGAPARSPATRSIAMRAAHRMWCCCWCRPAA